MTYLFFLGQTRELCFAELSAVASRLQLAAPTLVSDFIATIETDAEIDVDSLQLDLGGTIKIAQQITSLPLDTDVFATVVETLAQQEVKRFVIAEHNRDHLPVILATDVKRALSKQGVSSSYHETPRYGANAATLKHRNLTELHVVQLETAIVLARTVAAQDVDTWAQRDIEKPERDRQRGMLPPKVARMMLNIAIGADNPADHVVFDPFCGMGTILIEAADLGVVTLLGNDASPEAIMATQKNLTWWKSISKQDFSWELTTKPTENLEIRDFKVRPTIVVTEPFLGKLTPNEAQIPGIVRGLEKLYRGSLKALRQLVPVGGRMALILPSFRRRGKHITVEGTLKDLKKFNMNVIAGPFRGGRPSAVTQRDIYVIEYETYGTR